MFRSGKYYENEKRMERGERGTGGCGLQFIQGGFDRPDLQSDVRAET